MRELSESPPGEEGPASGPASGGETLRKVRGDKIGEADEKSSISESGIDTIVSRVATLERIWGSTTSLVP